MGTSYCQPHPHPQSPLPSPHPLPQSHPTHPTHPIHIKPPEPIARLTNTEDHVETLHTSSRRERFKGELVCKRKRRGESVERVLVSAMKGLGSSLSVGKIDREGNRRKRSVKSAYKHSLKKEITGSVERMSAKKLQDFLKKQKDFVEKKKRSIDNIRKLLEVQYEKQNPHRPSLNPTTNEMTKGRIPLLKRPHPPSPTPLKQLSSNPTHHSPQYLPQPLKTYMTFSSTSMLPPPPSPKRTSTLLRDLQSCFSRLLLTPEQPISYLLFVNVMRQMHMVTQPNSVDSGVFVAERELLHKAWAWITKSEDINRDCNGGRLRGFVMGLYGVGEGGDGQEVGRLFGVFRETRERILRVLGEKKPKDERKKNENKPPKKSIAARKWIQQPKQQTKGPKQQIKIDLSKNEQPRKSLQNPLSNSFNEVTEPTKPKNSPPQPVSEHVQSFHHNQTIDSSTFNKTILEIDIELGGRNQTIRVSQGDDPNAVASNFIRQFGLPTALQDRLASLISSGLTKVRQQQCQH